MSYPKEYHKNCGGEIIFIPQDDRWGKWDLPVCSKCDYHGPIPDREITTIEPLKEN